MTIFLCLKCGGASYREIEYYLKRNGVDISHESIRKRLKSIESANTELEKVDNLAYKNKVKKALINLRQTKNATDEQIKLLAEMYGVDIYLEDKKELER